MNKAVDLLEGYVKIFPPRKRKLVEVVDEICKEKPSDVDVLYRAEVERNPVNSEVWLGWINNREDSPWVKYALFELALANTPRSYKLWKRYLNLRVSEAKKHSIEDKDVYESVNALFDRALVNLYDMPRLWESFASFLIHQRKVTKTRRVLDEALRQLPITLHQRIWEWYITFLKMIGNHLPELSVSIWKRYLQLQPHHREIYVQFLLSNDLHDQAALSLSQLVNEENFVSLEGKSRHEIWVSLCELIATHAKNISSVDVEFLLRGGIRQFPDDAGRMWNWLAAYYIALGHHERARDVYEEALGKVTSVKDFSLVFSSYTEMEESILEALMKIAEQGDISEDKKTRIDDSIDFHMTRLDHIVDRRAEMLSLVKLRINPNNCYEWLNRAHLFDKLGDKERVLQTFAEATRTINPDKMLGSLSKLWIKCTEYYEKNGDVHGARQVLETALDARFVKMDDLASLWCERVELELRQGDAEAALSKIRQVIHRPKMVDTSDPKSIQNQLWRSSKLWSLALDMEENFGSLDTLKVVFEKMCDLKVISTAQLLNYAQVLEDKNYFESSFAVLETGAQLFKWPQLYHIWLIYLSKFVSRYEGMKLERSRDLFERAISDVPPQQAKRLFIMYMNMEEDFGLSRQALDVLMRAVDKVPENEIWPIYRLLISKTTTLFGILKTRPIFQQALTTLTSEDQLREVSLMFAKVERGLGELSRARQIFIHGSQFSNPNAHLDFWSEWREFEVLHGTEQDFHEMVRVKRLREQEFV